jgi:hypothetical protein
MPAFLKCVIIFTCLISVASAQNRGGNEGIPPPGYTDSGWVVLVGSYPFPSSAQGKAKDINDQFAGGEYRARVIQIPNALAVYSVLIGPDGSSLDEAAKLKFKADSDQLAADVVIWHKRGP